VAEDHPPQRPPRRRQSPAKPSGSGNTLTSPRPTTEMSPINSTGVTIVIDRTNSDDTEPTVVLGSTEHTCPSVRPAEDTDSAATEAAAALRMPHSVSACSDLTETFPSATTAPPNSNSQVFLLEDMA